MWRVKANYLGVAQGQLQLFSDFDSGGPMWTGQGKREIRKTVTFEEPFSQKPSVIVTISMWDLDQKTNQRADIRADNITREGFEIVFRTWADTRVARIRADWVAMGPADVDDMWDV